MARTFYNCGDVPIYLIAVSGQTDEYFTDSSKWGWVSPEIGAGEHYTYNQSFSSSYALIIGCKASDFVVGYNIAYQTSLNSPSTMTEFNYALMITGYKVTYESTDYIISGGNFFGTQSTVVVSCGLFKTDYNNILPTTFTNGVVTSNMVQVLDIPYDRAFYLQLTITANSGYTIYAQNTKVVYEYGTNKTQATLQLSDITSTDTYTFNHITVSGGIYSITFTINTAQTSYVFTISNAHLTNCVISETPTIEVDTPFTMTLQANDGYVFDSSNIPYLQYTISLGSDQKSFTISDDKKTATLTTTLTSSELSGTYNVTVTPYATAILSSDIPTTSYSFVNVNTITDDNLKELAKTRFYVADSSSPLNLVDLGQYVNSLKRFYCDVPTSETSHIVLGNIDTNVVCDIVSSDFITLECGNVTIESTNNNENDYNNTIYAILPFIGQVSLNANLIMNRTISIKYQVSTISGECVCVISSDNIPLYTFNGNISENVPYIMNNILWELKGDFSNPSCVLYGFIPKIIVIYNDNYNSSGVFYNDEKYGTISDVASGLCVIDDITINGDSMNNDEYDSIINSLHNGVIFD